MRTEDTTTSKHQKCVELYRNNYLFRNSVELLKSCSDAKEKESKSIEIIGQPCKAIADCQEQMTKLTIAASIDEFKYASALPGVDYMVDSLGDSNKKSCRHK